MNKPTTCKPRKMTVMIQDNFNAMCGGNMMYRAIEIELTPEQSERLELQYECQGYGPVAFEPATLYHAREEQS